jgi:hypothetical protein
MPMEEGNNARSEQLSYERTAGKHGRGPKSLPYKVSEERGLKWRKKTYNPRKWRKIRRRSRIPNMATVIECLMMMQKPI